MSYPKKYTDEVILAACAEWDARPTYKKLARKYGIKPGDVNYLINILGRKVREKYKHRNPGDNLQTSQISNDARGAIIHEYV